MELTLLSVSLAWEIILLASNAAGIAWWAKIETNEPDVTYWFGPFLSEKSLRSSLKEFESDLKGEFPKAFRKSFVRKTKKEPLTTIQREY